MKIAKQNPWAISFLFLSLVLTRSQMAVGPQHAEANTTPVIAVAADPVFNVDTTVDDALLTDCDDAIPQDCSLRGAIAAANALAPDAAVTINLPAGAYNLDATIGELRLGHNLTLAGAGAATTIINGGVKTGFYYTKVVVALTGLTVQDSAGDGIVNLGALTLTNSMVSNNAGTGIRNYSFVPLHTKLTLINSTVSNNRRTGIFAGSDGWLILIDSTISGNSSGGIEIPGESGAEITNSTISDNSGFDGGGIYLNDSASLTLTNSTVSGNFSRRYGGGILVGSSLKLVNSTVSNNTAQTSGGGIALLGGGALLYPKNTIIANNALSSGINQDCAFVQFGEIFSQGHNLDSDNTCRLTQPTDLPNCDPLLGPLQDNGGPTLTQAPRPGSPAIDAAGATCGLTTDQRGASRPMDSNGDGVAACDIGAVESDFSSSLDCSTATASVHFPRLGNRHRYPVTIRGVTAPNDEPVALAITSIFQDEPVINPTGTTCPDGIGVGTAVAKVRNERIITQAGDGRVYHIGFTATNAAGESCTGEVTVCVPSPQGDCGDQGALFDSTVCP